MSESVVVDRHEHVTTITIDRVQRRNAVDAPTAARLHHAFLEFEASDSRVAVLTGAGGNFCAGADLTALGEGELRHIGPTGPGPMGPTRMDLDKPVIAALEGYCVAGGLELALWCDLRVAAQTASLGVLNRRFGVPLVDLGTVRLPRIVGHGVAMDLMLTGRLVAAPEAKALGLVNRVVAHGQALAAAHDLAAEIAGHPQTAMRNDRRSAIEQWGLGGSEAMYNEARLGQATLESAETVAGVRRFVRGEGRHGRPLT